VPIFDFCSSSNVKMCEGVREADWAVEILPEDEVGECGWEVVEGLVKGVIEMVEPTHVQAEVCKGVGEVVERVIEIAVNGEKGKIWREKIKGMVEFPNYGQKSERGREVVKCIRKFQSQG
jgi:hypothetical protein